MWGRDRGELLIHRLFVLIMPENPSPGSF